MRPPSSTNLNNLFDGATDIELRKFTYFYLASKNHQNNVKDITNDYKTEQQKPNFGRRFVLTILTDSNLRLAKLAFWQLLMWPFLCSPWEKTKGGTQMTNTDEDQPDVLKEILKMQQETHKLIQQMAQDVRRLKNELGLRDVMR
jgi:hypothetical protein